MYSLNSNWQHFAVLIQGVLQPILAARLIGFNGNMDTSPSVDLECGTQLLTACWFKPSLPTIIYAHGFNGNVYDDTVLNISLALYDTYNKNIIILDWQEEASDAGMGTYWGYALHALPGAVCVGTILGVVIVDLVNRGINEDIHIIGHSLGAQLAGICGERTIELEFYIPRITGLDPAGPIFNDDVENVLRLDSSDGAFVDIYHTNPGTYGIEYSTGDADIWFNYCPALPVEQPGCGNVDRCSHDRSVYYFVESIRDPTAFVASKAENYAAWVAGNTDGTIYVGEFIDNCVTGNYYLTTYGSSPYGKGEKGAMY